MKRFLSIMLCTVVLFSLAACGSSVDANSDAEKKVSNESTENVKQTESTTAVATTVAETKKEGPDFSNAEKIFICSVGILDESNVENLVKEFGEKQYSKDEEIDLKEFEYFNVLKDFLKATIAEHWNGSFQSVDDYVVKNAIGDGYFKLDFTSTKLSLLYVAS